MRSSKPTLLEKIVADDIVRRKPKVSGIYRLVMKAESDSFRSSSTQGIMKRIKAKGIDIIVYEPSLKESTLYNSRVIEDIELFKQEASLIVANRKSEALGDVVSKVYTRDCFGG